MADPNNRPVTGYPAPATNGHPPPPSNTSYPYAAPPPAAYYNQQYYTGPAYHQPDPDAIRRATFLRRLFAFIIAGVIILGTILFIIWLVLRPRLPEFRVDSLSVSNFNLSSSTLVSADFDVKITARNPNGKITLFYDNVEAAVYFKNFQLSQTTLPPFSQGKKNETSFTAELAAVKAYLDGDIANGINGERGKNGNVVLNVRMLMEVRFKAGAWKARRRYLKAFCGDLSVGISANASNGTLTGGPRQCRVGL
nr:NDR1/HIN1-like protein 10 [Coffea arabica]